MHNRFTLVEMMIVVAIITTLAAIAVPAYAETQVRAKFAENPLSIDGIEKALRVATAEQPEKEIDTQTWPSSPAGKALRPWNPIISAWGGAILDWPELWAPDGQVRCSYYAKSNNPTITTVVWCDVDGDGDVRLSSRSYDTSSVQGFVTTSTYESCTDCY